ncbi:hypothetical protein HG530_012504 [Fusarium avenaceum]|nr:hypothetical protein HG530_012504 [Fusarium avenaceum]
MKEGNRESSVDLTDFELRARIYTRIWDKDVRSQISLMPFVRLDPTLLGALSDPSKKLLDARFQGHSTWEIGIVVFPPAVYNVIDRQG